MSLSVLQGVSVLITSHDRGYILVQFRDQIRADAFKTRVSIENELRSAVYSCGGKIFAETDVDSAAKTAVTIRICVYMYISFQNSILIAIHETDDTASISIPSCLVKSNIPFPLCVDTFARLDRSIGAAC